MYPVHTVQRHHMAQQTAKSQQVGARRAYQQPHQQQNTDRIHADGARPVPTTSRKPCHQDRNPRDAGLRKPVSRKPRSLRAPQRHLGPKTALHWGTVPGPQQGTVHMSEMYTMIDDHLAWNRSPSGLETARPGSSGTMFVDFDTNGNIKVSYRNGVNKKLPTPSVPAKPMPSRQTMEREDQGTEARKVSEGEKPKLVPRNPSYSSCYDSVLSSGCPEDARVEGYLEARPLPRVPPRDSRRRQVQDRAAQRSHPPQVHQTQNTRQLTSASPTPSHFSSPPLQSSYLTTTPLSRCRTTYTDPSGIQVQYYSPANTDSNPSSRAYVTGYDRTTNYTYDYDGRTMHVHGSPTSSRRGSYTSEYFNISAASYRHDDGARLVEKPLPHLPHGPAQLPEPPHLHEKKRRRVMSFVNRLLRKLDRLGVMNHLSSCHRHSRSSKGVGETQTWVERGYMT